MKSALVILGKYPHPGKVKTRLSKDLGSDQAAKFYKDLLEKLFQEIKSLKDITSFFCYADINDKTLIQDWLGKEILLIDPVSNNIETNLSNAFEQLLKDFDQVISIASDVPSVNNKLITDAFGRLRENDIVIGPDEGGGIYLYGTKKHFPDFFNSPVRKDETIFNQTLNNIEIKNLKVSVLKKLLDVDTIVDFNKWKSRC